MEFFIFDTTAGYLGFITLTLPIIFLAVYFLVKGKQHEGIAIDFVKHRNLLFGALIFAVFIFVASFTVNGGINGPLIVLIVILLTAFVLPQKTLVIPMSVTARGIGFLITAGLYVSFLYWVIWGSIFYHIGVSSNGEKLELTYLFPERQVIIPLHRIESISIKRATFPQYERNLQIYVTTWEEGVLDKKGEVYRSRQFKPWYREEIDNAIPTLEDLFSRTSDDVAK